MNDSAVVARALATQARSGHTMRTALRELPALVPPSGRDAAERAATLVTLGAPSGLVLQRLFEELGPPGDSAGPALRICTEVGGRVSTLLERIADLVDLHEGQTLSGRSASAGARLSARMVAGLPLAFIPFMPFTGAAPRDALGALLALVGLGLGLAGFRWIARLVPRADENLDRASLAALLIAATARAGIAPRSLLLALTGELQDEKDPLARAGRLMRLGLGWHAALARCSDEGYRELARTVDVAAGRGVPVADSLESFARARMDLMSRDLDTSIKRAPILMVLPLALCVLPSFLLLAIAPFLRSLFG